MKTLRITKADLNERNEYTRSRDLEFEGHIEVEASLGWITVNGFIRAVGGLFVEAGSSIKAGGSINAGESIEAGWSIKAGESINAGESIKAGESIRCKAQLAAKLRIFAGIGSGNLPKPDEQVIECAELVEGTVCFGELRFLTPSAPIAEPTEGEDAE